MAYLRNITAKRLNLSGFSSLSRKRSSTSLPLVYSEEVICAKSESKPIVALESTIIAHGMPYPQNLETAVQVENIIRQQGAVPATIAILKGQITVGLDKKQLKYLAQAKDVLKASRRDLAPIAAAKSNGATTVAGTLVAADLADVPVFVTGGLGGVHRGVENTMDISADLTELGRSKTLVVCSGVKSILDIGRTLEYLETQGVCVCAFGQTTDFPAFYTTRSGFQAPHNVVDAQQAANVLYAAHKLGLCSGTVVAVPVPKQCAMDEKEIEKAIETALDEAKKKGIKGKEITPFILSAVAKITDGASLATNIALIKNNAKVGADIAVEFSKLKNVDNLGSAFNIDGVKGKFSPIFSRKFHTSCLMNLGIGKLDSDSQIKPRLNNVEGDVLVIGGANVDRTYRVTEDNIQLDGSTHACLMEQCGGGVGRNMAEALWRLRSGRTRLLTAIGDDNDGKYLMDLAPGLIHEGCVIRDRKTATYAAVLDSRGECKLGLGDMDLHNAISKEMVEKHFKILQECPMVILDGNVPQSTINYVLQLCHEMDKPAGRSRHQSSNQKRGEYMVYPRRPVYPMLGFICHGSENTEDADFVAPEKKRNAQNTFVLYV